MGIFEFLQTDVLQDSSIINRFLQQKFHNIKIWVVERLADQVEMGWKLLCNVIRKSS